MIADDVKQAARERCIAMIDALLANNKMPMIIVFDDRTKNVPGWSYVFNRMQCFCREMLVHIGDQIRANETDREIIDHQ